MSSASLVHSQHPTDLIPFSLSLPPPSENDTQSLLPKSSFGVLLQGAGRRLIRLLHALDRIPIQVAWSRGEEPSLPAPTRAMAILSRLVTVT